MFLAEFYSKVLYVHTCSNFQQIKFFFKSDICECIFLDRNASPNINELYIWVQSLHTLQNCCNRGGNTLFKYMNYVSIFVTTVWKCLFLFYRRGSPSTFDHIMNGSRSAFKVTPDVFSWDQNLAFCRPVKFFHTD